MKVVPLTQELLDGYFGHPVGLRIKGYAAVEGDQVMGVGGVVFWPSSAITGFMDVKPEARRHKLLMHKTALRLLADWRAMGGKTLRIFCDAKVPRSREWATRLGFEPLTEDLDAAWIWRAT